MSDIETIAWFIGVGAFVGTGGLLIISWWGERAEREREITRTHQPVDFTGYGDNYPDRWRK